MKILFVCTNLYLPKIFFIQKLGKIIERDFFPDLENLTDKVEFLEAREANDIERLQLFYRKYSTGGRLATPASVADSPATFDTPEPNSRVRKKRMRAPSEHNDPVAQDDMETESISSKSTYVCFREQRNSSTCIRAFTFIGK